MKISLRLLSGFIFTIMLHLCGGVTLFLGSLYFLNKEDRIQNKIVTKNIIYSCMVIGICIIVSTFTGLLGSVKPIKFKHFIKSYLACVFCLLIAKLVIGIFVWFCTIRLHVHFGEVWANWSYYDRGFIEKMGYCCGYKDPEDHPARLIQCRNVSDDMNGCEDFIVDNASYYLTQAYTLLFGLIIVDLAAFLGGSVLLVVADEVNRYNKGFEKLEKSKSNF